MKSISYYSIAVATFLTFALFASYTDADEQPLGLADFSDNHKLPQIIKPERGIGNTCHSSNELKDHHTL